VAIVMMLELATVAVVVSPPPQKAAEWYRDKLGLEVRAQEGHWVVVASKGSKTGIHLCESDTLEPGNTGVLFTTADIEAAVRELKAKGVRFTQELTKEPWGTYAMFADPYGNEFWLMPSE